MSWLGLWRELAPDDQKSAVASFFDTADSPSSKKALTHLFARGLNMREQTLAQWPRERLIAHVAKHGELAIPAGAWSALFLSYFRGHRQGDLAAIYRHLNIDPPEDHAVPTLDAPILPDAARACIGALSATLAPPKLRGAVSFLGLMDETWRPLVVALEILPAPDAELPSVKKDPAQVLEGFTTVDRVVIEQIVNASSEAESALETNELDDLLQTLIALNPLRKRSYLVLGYADVLISQRSLEFARPEFDDRRRSWYLTGALLGLARQRRYEELTSLLVAQAESFRHASSDAGPGLALARSLLPELVRIGRVGEAVQLVTAQCQRGGLSIAELALVQAVQLLRSNSIADAMAILRPLWDAYGEAVPETTTPWIRFQRQLTRRVAQCLQAQADYVRAAELLERISASGEPEERARVLADRGLVAAGQPSLLELHLPHDVADRRTRVAALTAGEPLLVAALNLWQGHVVTAMFALGQLNFLRWRLHNEVDNAQRDVAISWLEGAVTEMRLTEAAATYERSGLLGQSLFMLTLLRLYRAGPTDISSAIETWKQIGTDAGMFPDVDLQMLLDTADVVADAHATYFAESIWTYRQAGALNLVLSPSRLERSVVLRREVLAVAQDPATSRAKQRQIWKMLVPVLLKHRDAKNAIAGLDALESTAEGDEGLQDVVQFLASAENYEPAWSEIESLWARVRLTRKLGDDSSAAKYLQLLFYRARDNDLDVAAQIPDLLRVWRIGGDLAEQLADALPSAPAENGSDVQGRLARGEAVSIVFVGGNEIQEQYDEKVSRNLATRYPGLRLKFRHTGWTSNWGQQLPGLIAECNAADAVVLMTMMRTMLGRSLRDALKRPWVSCVARGEKGIERSILKAVDLALRLRPAMA